MTPLRQRLRQTAAYASVAVSTLLIVGKLVAYLATDSVTMLSSLVDSTLDLLGAAVTAFGIASAVRPPDQDHRFGHGKAEPLATLAQAAFITGSAVLLVYEAISRLYEPHEIHNDGVAYAVTGFSVVAILGLVALQTSVVRQTGSMAIRADRLHYLNDLAVNLAVLVAFGLHHWVQRAWIDPVFTLFIAVGLAASGYSVARTALDALMDREVPETDRARIRAIIAGQPGVTGVFAMRTRTDGDRIFVEVDVEMDGGLTLQEAHTIGVAVADAVRQEIPRVDVLLHEDPAGVHVGSAAGA